MSRAAGSCSLLLLDAVWECVLWLLLLTLRCCPGGLCSLWTFCALKWTCLHVSSTLLMPGSTTLRRLTALLCLLPPVCDSVLVLMGKGGDISRGLSPNGSIQLLLRPASAVLACLVWEVVLSGGTKRSSEEDRRQLLVRMLKLFKADTVHLTAAFTSLILGVLCDTYVPWCQGKVVDMLRTPQLSAHFGVSVGELALLCLGSAFFSGVRGGLFKCALARLNRRLKLGLLHRLLQQELHFYTQHKPGELSARLDGDVDQMGRTVALNTNAMVRSVVKTCLMLRIMLALSWELTVLTLLEMPLLALVQRQHISLQQELKVQMRDSLAHNKDLVSQTIGAIRVVRSSGGEREELRRLERALQRTAAVRRRTGLYSVTFHLMQRLLSLGLKVLMFLQARSLLSSNQLSIGSLLTFLLYLRPISHSLKEIILCYGDTASTVGIISKVFSYLDRTPKWNNNGDLCPEQLQGDVVLHEVTFCYPSAPDRPAVKAVSARLRPHSVTALVGPSGSGKSTLTSLLKRLYEPQEGQILLDGEPLHRYTHRYLQDKVALVSQNPVLFSGSLKYNIEYGLKDVPFQKVKEAVEKVDAQQLMSTMESEEDSDVGQTLSEGAKQLVSIIRALVRGPKVIILDEATSNLDVNVQHAVLQEVLAQGRTVLMVAHQLQTVKMADHILFMEDGAVVEQGTHEELMERKGRYCRLEQQLFSEGGV